MMAEKTTSPRPVVAATPQEASCQVQDASPLALPATPPAEDAGLFALCDAFDAEEARAVAAWDSLPAEEAECVADACIARQKALAEQIGATPARTLHGILRKLLSIAVDDPAKLEILPSMMLGDLMVCSVLRDALGSSAPRPSVARFRAARAKREEAVKLCRDLLRLRAAAREADQQADELTRQVAMLGVLP